MIKNLRDLAVGTIAETREHGFYIVLPDGAGRTAMFNERGTWARCDQTPNMFTDDGKKEVVRVYGFTQALPVLDQISEGIKFIYDTRHNTSELFKIWESETEGVTAAKRRIAELKKSKSDIDRELSTLSAAVLYA